VRRDDTVLALVGTRRFWPLCLTQACTAVNDNLVRNALVVLALFRAGSAGPILVALAAGLFIFPYMLLSASAGQLADCHDKARLIRALKLTELTLMSVAALGFLLDSLPVLLAVLVGLGVQASLFGPVKYGILPDHLRPEELLVGNGVMEATTFVAILIGTMAGGWLVLLPHGAVSIASVGLAVSAVGVLAALSIPPAPPHAQAIAVDWHLVRATLTLLRQARSDNTIWQPILGISWFWTLGATLVAEFPVVAKLTLGAGGEVVTLFLTVFSLGIGIGSLLCARLLHGEVSGRYVPLALIGISLFTWDFSASCEHARGLISASAIIGTPQGWRILLDLGLLSTCGGFYSVPLYTMIQQRADPAWRARMVAANNVVNAAFMVGGAVVAAVLAAVRTSAIGILLAMALVNVAAVVWSLRFLPTSPLFRLVRGYVRLFHRITVTGMQHYPPPSENAVVVPNHLSLADGPLLAAFLPGSPVFVVDTRVAARWWARPFLACAETICVDTLNPFAVRTMIQAVRQGQRLVLFPEGRITITGGLMKVHDGAGMIADRAAAKLVPVRIDGTQFSHLSRLGGRLRRQWFPHISITIFPPVTLSLDPGLLGRRRRRAAAQTLHDLMVEAAFATQPCDRSLFAALLDAAHRYGWLTRALIDADRQWISYGRVLLGACLLSRALANRTTPGECVGVLLPNASGTVIAFMALQAVGRVPAMLNATAGSEGMLTACHTAGIQCVISSRRFAESRRVSREIERMAGQVVFIWLEELRASLRWRSWLRGCWDSFRARHLPGSRMQAGASAVVLFTSGTEGAPKGVVLSHANILANCAQIAAVIDFTSDDLVFDALPMFHAFGLTVGTLLPLLFGLPTFLYPTPLHYRLAPELIYTSNATIVLSTDTLLAGWARYAHPYDFRSVRYLFAGAERLKEATRRLYAERFGVRVLEGYGATETAPVLSINTPMRNAPGSVGRFLPGISWRVEPMQGLTTGGRLWVKGPNVMIGYLRASAPCMLEPLTDGWYDTGDIIDVDLAGFVWVKDRAKRFAKIGGELVPMAVGEALANRVWPGETHAVIALPDIDKGERLVLITSCRVATPDALRRAARDQWIGEIMVPHTIFHLDRLPRLGSGKVNYPAVQRMVEARLVAS
jgi:acyl-[acyl-carrier-protein]-phospholipid O-acyltransferase/long-chain-fatty-acid--[acyl-carrier-protein] ligase